MGADVPKQYLKIDEQTILLLTLSRLFSAFPLASFVVALAETDCWWSSIQTYLPCAVVSCVGGARRDLTVVNALKAARDAGAANTDWVMVHDAVRPCVPVADLHRLWRAAIVSGEAALLGVPVVDSLRRLSPEQGVTDVVPRADVWRVFTPQLFPLWMLESALALSVSRSHMVSDESEAVVAAGYRVNAVRGSEENFKITYPEDLQRAADVIRRQSLSMKT
jgi:2-C-methyl-D-erythritol 4-phosphate cytidylyltransferase